MTEKANQNWLQLATVQMGGVFTLPILMVGFTVAHSTSFASACITIATGNFLLMLLSWIGAAIAFKTKKTTVDYASDCFGPSSHSLFGLIYSLTMLGWFAVQLNMIVENLMTALRFGEDAFFTRFLLYVFLDLLILFSSMRGIQRLEKISRWVGPILVCILGYVISLSERGMPQSVGYEVSFARSISFIVSAGIFAVVDLPTYWRHSLSLKDGLLAATVIFGFALPLMEVVGAYLAFSSSDDSLILALIQKIPGLWIPLFFFFSGWIGNSLNLYSAVSNSSGIAPKINTRDKTILWGILGLVLAMTQIANSFVIFLECMGVPIAAVGGVLFFRVFLSLPSFSASYVSAAFGCFLGFLSFFNIFGITNAPTLDAWIGSSILLTILQSKYYVLPKRK